MAIFHAGLLYGAARSAAAETGGDGTPKETADSKSLSSRIYDFFFKSISKAFSQIVSFFSFKSVIVIHHSEDVEPSALLPKKIAYEEAKKTFEQAVLKKIPQYEGCSRAFAGALADLCSTHTEWEQGLRSLIQQECTQLEEARNALDAAMRKKRDEWQTRSMSDIPSAGIETQEEANEKLSQTI